MMRALARLMRALPRELERLHLQYALRSLSKHAPFHPDLPWIVLRLSELENAS
jgi:hypothetical protein